MYDRKKTKQNTQLLTLEFNFLTLVILRRHYKLVSVYCNNMYPAAAGHIQVTTQLENFHRVLCTMRDI